MKRETWIILGLLAVALLLYLRRFGLSLGIGRNLGAITKKVDSSVPAGIDNRPNLEGVTVWPLEDDGREVDSASVQLDYPNPAGGLFAPRMQRGKAVAVAQDRLNQLVAIGAITGPVLEVDGIYDYETKKQHDKALEKVGGTDRSLNALEKVFELV